MDELQISGKRFISSRRIARDNGYTSDYIGQLIRGGKVTGQKVGRAWYVDAVSFSSYLDKEGAPANTAATEETFVKENLQVQEPVTEESIVEETVSEPPAPVEKASEPPAPTPAPVEKIPEPVVVMQKEEPPVHHVPLHIQKKEEPVEQPSEAIEEKNAAGGLRYYAEESPSLREIRLDKRESRIEEDSFQSTEVKDGISAPISAHKSSALPVVALAVAGIAVFIFSAVVSSTVSLNLRIDEGNTAATSYS